MLRSERGINAGCLSLSLDWFTKLMIHGVDMNYYIKALRNFANFKGRSTRREYWIFVLFNIIVSIVIMIVAGVVGSVLGYGKTFSDMVNGIYSLGILVPGLAVGVRRLHDIGKSGWWIVVPFLNLIFFCFAGDPNENEYGLPSR
ncbi:DUF805 domain-containing protein [Jeongeupia naejangsanensis]|uniref:DUF805 domain-containing protein n=1 Tax=Jeongeupia naejangsanensis TaxID=613195 RepID=UPI0036D274D8